MSSDTFKHYLPRSKLNEYRERLFNITGFQMKTRQTILKEIAELVKYYDDQKDFQLKNVNYSNPHATPAQREKLRQSILREHDGHMAEAQKLVEAVNSVSWVGESAEPKESKAMGGGGAGAGVPLTLDVKRPVSATPSSTGDIIDEHLAEMDKMAVKMGFKSPKD